MLAVDGGRLLSVAFDGAGGWPYLKIKHIQNAWSVLTTTADGLKILALIDFETDGSSRGHH